MLSAAERQELGTGQISKDFVISKTFFCVTESSWSWITDCNF